MKYILVNCQGIISAIIFPEHINHCDAINRAKLRPISAGYCALRDGQVTTYGESTSLKLGPGLEDAEYIKVTLFMLGLVEVASNQTIEAAYGLPKGSMDSFLDSLPFHANARPA